MGDRPRSGKPSGHESLVALYEDQRREEEAAHYRALLALVHREYAVTAG